VLISLHLPKTAGTSFLALLETHYGDALVRDYGDRPLHCGALRRRVRAAAGGLRNALPSRRLRDAACIHGHFLPLKYARLPGRRHFVVWLRDPVERLASHYHYWNRSYDRGDAGRLHRRVVEERWTLERFCLGPELRNIYSTFLWRFPLERFDFVGITERYDEDVHDFAARFLDREGTQPPPATVNAGHRGGVGSPWIEDPAFRARVEAHHARDVILYHRALALAERRRG
jgi:hypothetical protein